VTEVAAAMPALPHASIWQNSVTLRAAGPLAHADFRSVSPREAPCRMQAAKEKGGASDPALIIVA